MLALKPDNVPALTALGRLELLDHNDTEAIGLLERALRINPADAESTYQLGVLYDRNGRTEEGAKLLRRAITLRANYPDPHYQLGRIAMEHPITRPHWRSSSWRAGCCPTRRRSGWPWGGSFRLWGGRQRPKRNSQKCGV